MPKSFTFISAAILVLFFVSCKDEADVSNGGNGGNDENPPPETECGPLFGAPTENSGLSLTECRPICECEEMSYAPTVLTVDDIADFEQRELLNPQESLEENPYDNPGGYPLVPDKVCALIVDGTDSNAYTLGTYDNLQSAQEAGATVTHTGACGRCSSLADLAVYMKNGDLTGPVRACAMADGLDTAFSAVVDCLVEIGFTENCAEIWAYNSKNTSQECLSECLENLESPYHNPNGSLNDCIQCDEDESGPVFKAVSGRTRRNSGLPSALCRPCETVSQVEHVYPYF